MCQGPQADACRLSGLSWTLRPAALGLNPAVESRGVRPAAEPQQGMAYGSWWLHGTAPSHSPGPCRVAHSAHTQQPSRLGQGESPTPKIGAPVPLSSSPFSLSPLFPRQPVPWVRWGIFDPLHRRVNTQGSQVIWTLEVGKVFRFTESSPLNPASATSACTSQGQEHRLWGQSAALTLTSLRVHFLTYKTGILPDQVGLGQPSQQPLRGAPVGEKGRTPVREAGRREGGDCQ